MLHRMTLDTIFARCGELIGRWTAAFTEGVRRGRQQDIPVPRRMPATSDPDLHPFEYASDR